MKTKENTPARQTWPTTARSLLNDEPAPGEKYTAHKQHCCAAIHRSGISLGCEEFPVPQRPLHSALVRL